jgi:flagellar hook-basal body complex protein FliE
MTNSSNYTNESAQIQNSQNTNTQSNTPISISKFFHNIIDKDKEKEKEKEKEREMDKEGDDRDRITPTRSASIALTKATHFLAQKSASIPRRFSLMGSAPFSANISVSPSAPFLPHPDADSGVSAIGERVCCFSYLYLWTRQWCALHRMFIVDSI